MIASDIVKSIYEAHSVYMHGLQVAVPLRSASCGMHILNDYGHECLRYPQHHEMNSMQLVR
jgi:hypothetical protein